MEKMNVFGIQALNFDGRDGNHVEGLKFHCTKDTVSDKWTGKAYEGIFISARSSLIDLAKQVKPGDTLDVSFNRYGKPDNFSICK